MMPCYKCGKPLDTLASIMCPTCHSLAVIAAHAGEQEPVGCLSCPASYELRCDIHTHAVSIADSVKLNRTSRNGERIKKGHHLS